MNRLNPEQMTGGFFFFSPGDLKVSTQHSSAAPGGGQAGVRESGFGTSWAIDPRGHTSHPDL